MLKYLMVPALTLFFATGPVFAHSHGYHHHHHHYHHHYHHHHH